MAPINSFENRKWLALFFFLRSEMNFKSNPYSQQFGRALLAQTTRQFKTLRGTVAVSKVEFYGPDIETVREAVWISSNKNSIRLKFIAK